MVAVGIFQKKNKKGELRTYFSETSPLELLGFLLYPWKFQTKQSFTPRNSTKLCYTPQKFQDLKPKPLGIPHDFIFITPGNSMLFFINPWKFHLLFLQYPWKFHILSPLGFFSGIARLMLLVRNQAQHIFMLAIN